MIYTITRITCILASSRDRDLIRCREHESANVFDGVSSASHFNTLHAIPKYHVRVTWIPTKSTQSQKLTLIHM